MFKRCKMCGKLILGGQKERNVCPRCGSALSSDGTTVDSNTRDAFSFPPRRNRSLQDRLDRQKQETLEIKAVGESHIFVGWDDILKERPMDAPYYTAFKGRACVVILMSSQSVRNAELIETVLASERPLALQVEAFLKGSYPILRCNFVFPDNPDDPLVLESPLDVTDGDVQDFCNAVIGDETVDIILTHEQLDGGTYAFAARASRLAEVLRQEVNRALGALKPAATVQDFHESVKAMEGVFPSGSSGVSPQKCVRMKIVGEARHKHIEY